EQQRVADGLGPPPAIGQNRAEQKGEIHSRPAKLPRTPGQRGEHHRADEAADERRGQDGHGHAAQAWLSAQAALISARWTSACGKLPRNAPVRASTASE